MGSASTWTPVPETAAWTPVEDHAQQDHSTFTGALKEYWGKVNPLAQGNAIVAAAKDIPGAVKSYRQQTEALLDEAEESFKKGDYAEGVRHGLSFLLNGLPGVGAALDEAGNKAQSGDYAGAAVDTAALATNLVAARYAPAAATKVAEGIGAAPAAARSAGMGALKIAAMPETGTAVGAAAGSSVGHPIVGAMVGRAGSAYAQRLLGRIQHSVGSAIKEAPAMAEEAAPAAEASRIVAPEESTSVPRSAERQAIVNQLNKPQTQADLPQPANTVTSPKTAEEAPAISAREATNRSKLAQDLADFLHSDGQGISHEDALRMGPDQWKLARTAVRQTGKASAPSPATVQLALEHLKALEEHAGVPAKVAPIQPTSEASTLLRGKSLDIAQRLAAEMSQ